MVACRHSPVLPGLSDIFEHLPDEHLVARGLRDTAVAPEIADDAPGFPHDQVRGTDIPLVQIQLPIAVQQPRRDAAQVIGRRSQPPYVAHIGYDPRDVVAVVVRIDILVVREARGEHRRGEGLLGGDLQPLHLA